MSISYIDAVKLLKDVTTWGELREIINQLDVVGSGTKTVLYSGDFSGSVSAHGITLALSKSNSDIRIVDNTAAAKFLDFERNAALLEVLERLDPHGHPSDSGKVPNGPSQSESNKFLFDVNYNGQLGAWATVSHNFVSSPATTGNVRIVGAFADPTRVMGQVEIPALINNPNVTFVDGHHKSDLTRLHLDAQNAGRNSNAVVMARVVANSADALSLIALPVDTKGAVAVDAQKVPTSIDTTRYFHDDVQLAVAAPPGVTTDTTSNIVNAAQAENKIRVPDSIKADPDKHLNDVKFAQEQQAKYLNERKAAAEAAADASALAKAEKLLAKLGVAGDALALGLVIREAQAADAAGDSERAIKILQDWAADFSGGIAGAAAAAALANSIVAPLYFFPPLGTVIAGGLTIVAGIAGGLLAGDAFVKIMSWLLAEDDDSVVKQPPPPTPPGNYVDPLSMDLNGDGIVNTLPLSDGVQFDLDNNGFAETTSWVAPEDGLLVFDINSNGKIDAGNELFGTDTLLGAGGFASNGFEALDQYDFNDDGVINHQDYVFNLLRVWQDANSNGVVDDGELTRLYERGISHINTQYTTNISTDINNVQHREQSHFQYNNGGSGLAQTLWFETNKQYTVPTQVLNGNGIYIDLEIRFLPDAKGYGNVYTLHQAMALDSSGKLKEKVHEFYIENDVSKRKALINEILVLWTGQQNVRSDSRGSHMDAQHLGVLESFWGIPAPHPMPDARYAAELNAVYEQLSRSIYTQMASTQYMEFLSSINIETINGKEYVDFTQTAALFAGLFDSQNPHAKYYLNEFLEILKGIDPYNANTTITPNNFINELLPVIRALPQVIQNEFFDNVDWDKGAVEGTDGNDELYGLDSDNLILGGKGDDSYHIFRGGGNDVISDSDGIDTIIFDAGITPTQVNLQRSIDALVIKLNSGEEITVVDMFKSPTAVNVNNIEDEKNAVLVKGLTTSWMAGAEKYIEQYFGLTGHGDMNLELIPGASGGAVAYVTPLYNANNTNKAVSQTLTIELADIDFNYLMATDGALYLDRIIAHEMVHAVMASNMNTMVLPGWFNEGAAELIHGADERVIGELGNLPTQAAFNNFFKTTTGSPSTSAGYAVSYIAVKYLDASIRDKGGDGIREVFAQLKLGNTFDQALGIVSAAHTGLSTLWYDLASFESRFRNVGFSLIESLLNLDDNDTGSLAGSDYGNTELNAKNVLPERILGASRFYNLIIPESYIDPDAPIVNTKIEYLEFEDGTRWDFAKILSEVTSAPEISGVNYGYEGDDEIIGSSNPDRLRGLSGNDALDGLQGDDLLIGDEGNDNLTGGIGNDLLQGGAGNDIYYYRLGDGQDVIKDVLGNDVIQIDSSIPVAAISFQNDLDGNLKLVMPDGGSITVENVFDMETGMPSDNAVEMINNISWSDIKNQVLHADHRTDIVYGFGTNDWITGQSNDNNLYGGDGNDTIRGGDGNDQLFGGDGADILEGDGGNDTLSGGTGNDNFIYRDGHDVVVDADQHDYLEFRDGGNLKPYIDGFDLVISTAQGGSVTFKNAVNSEGALDSQKIVGTINSVHGLWAFDDLIQKIWEHADRTVTGTYGADLLEGGKGNDTLIGGKGNDTYSGGEGNDIYRYALNDGNDLVLPSSGNDVLKFANGINESDIRILKGDENTGSGGAGYIVVVDVAGVGSITFRHKDYLPAIHFSNGTEWSANHILEIASIETQNITTINASPFGGVLNGSTGKDSILGGNGDDVLYGFTDSDSLIGGNGSDKLYGGTSDDVLDGGSGDDYLDGGAGKDTLLGGSGNDILIVDISTTPGNGGLIESVTTEANGGADNDTYRIAYSSRLAATITDSGGIDVIELGVGWDASKTIVRKEDNSLWILDSAVANPALVSRAQVKISDMFASDGSLKNANAIEGIHFAGGVTWSQQKILELALTGTQFSDQIIGTPGNDILRGQGGNDALYGMAGNDAYHYGVGDGIDSLMETSGTDVLYFGAGITPNQLVLTRDYGRNLNISILDQHGAVTNQSVHISRWFSDDKYKIESFIFADSTVWSGSAIKLSDIKGSSQNDVIKDYYGYFGVSGGLGDDFIDLFDNFYGNKIIYNLGDGDDVIYVGTGENTIEFGAGINADDIVVKYLPSNDNAHGHYGTAKLVFEFSDGGSLTFLQMISSLDSLFLGDYYGVHTIKEVKFSDSSTKPISFFLEQIGYDVVAPVKPLVRVDATRKIITGVAEPGSVVEIKNASNVVLGAVTANSTDGGYTINLLTALALNQTVNVTAKDSAGNHSLPQKIVGGVVIDTTPPQSPAANFDLTGKVITGTAEAGALVEAKSEGGILFGNATASANGDYTITLTNALINKESVKVTAKDAAGNTSDPTQLLAPDKTPPTVNSASFEPSGAVVSGSAEPGVVVRVKDLEGKVLGGAVADAVSGAFTIVLNTPLINSERVKVYARDAADNYSTSLSIYAPDKTAPSAPVAQLDAARSIISGTAELGSVIKVLDSADKVLRSTKADSSTGTYSITLPTTLPLGQIVKVTATDKSGNPSTAMIVGGNVPDITPPEIFSVEFDNSGGFVSGVAEAGVTVRVKTLTGVVLGGVVSDPVTGAFTIPLASPLINNERVKVYARDTAGNYSTSISIFAPDFTRPEIPVAALDATRKIISGTAEAGSTIKIVDLNDKVLKTVKADSTSGAFTITLSTALKEGESIKITATDKSSNVSSPLELGVKVVAFGAVLRAEILDFVAEPVSGLPAASSSQLDNLIQAMASFSPDNTAGIEVIKPHSDTAGIHLAVGF